MMKVLTTADFIFVLFITTFGVLETSARPSHASQRPHLHRSPEKTNAEATAAKLAVQHVIQGENLIQKGNQAQVEMTRKAA